MQSVLRIVPATCHALGLALVLALGLAGAPAGAQTADKPASPAAVAAAKEILAMKSANQVYANAVLNIVHNTKDALLKTNLNYQKDLNEIEPLIVQKFNGREKEIGDGMAQVYASQFTEQELKDLVTFYKSPLGQKLLSTEPKAIQMSMGYMNQWAAQFVETVNAEFRAEMRKRGKEI